MHQIGRVGDSSVLDTAIGRVAGDPKKVHHSVTLRLMELGVKMSSNDTGDAVLHYTYPEVNVTEGAAAKLRVSLLHPLLSRAHATYVVWLPFKRVQGDPKGLGPGLG